MDLEHAEELAFDLMQEHGLLDEGWTFGWDRAKARNGQCRHYARKITLSRPLTQVREENWVRNTILHEIAHALAPVGSGHDRTWQRIARRIGATPERCSADSGHLPFRWIGVCHTCGHIFQRHRIARGTARCGKCRTVIEWNDTQGERGKVSR
jgi:predicted SprT family Zn-dependent metalloprotease